MPAIRVVVNDIFATSPFAGENEWIFANHEKEIAEQQQFMSTHVDQRSLEDSTKERSRRRSSCRAPITRIFLAVSH